MDRAGYSKFLINQLHLPGLKMEMRRVKVAGCYSCSKTKIFFIRIFLQLVSKYEHFTLAGVGTFRYTFLAFYVVGNFVGFHIVLTLYELGLPYHLACTVCSMVSDDDLLFLVEFNVIS